MVVDRQCRTAIEDQQQEFGVLNGLAGPTHTLLFDSVNGRPNSCSINDTQQYAFNVQSIFYRIARRTRLR